VSTPFGIDTKRFYWPGSFEATCPKCGHKRTIDGSSRYLSYPTANVPFDFTIGCPECDEGWSVRAILRLSFELLPPEPAT
jgi:hypothetical protein